MKKLIVIALIITAVTGAAYGQQAKTGQADVIYLTNDQFKKLVFNYDVNKEWKYEGDKPAIIDFFASWCGPCRTMSPRLEEAAKEYAGKIVVYKVDTDKEQVLSASLGIQSLPTIVFIPKQGKPQASIGVISEESLNKAIKDILLKE